MRFRQNLCLVILTEKTMLSSHDGGTALEETVLAAVKLASDTHVTRASAVLCLSCLGLIS